MSAVEEHIVEAHCFQQWEEPEELFTGKTQAAEEHQQLHHHHRKQLAQQVHIISDSIAAIAGVLKEAWQ